MIMRFVPVLFASFLMFGCGGGSSSDGTVFQGTLTQRGPSHSSAESSAKHSSGERIGEVKVCILGECSITDEQGQWGVNVGDFSGGDFAIILEGHGISASVSADVPADAKDVYIDLDHQKGVVSISKLMIDGEDHTGHSHDDHHS